MSNDEARTDIGMTLDCGDPAAQARFWIAALGYVQSPPPQGWDRWEDFLADQGVPPDEWNDAVVIADPHGRRPTISLLKVPEPKSPRTAFT